MSEYTLQQFTPDEVKSVYTTPDDRYVVSLVVSYDDEGMVGGVSSPQEAAAYAQDLARDAIWCVHDRVTKATHFLDESEMPDLREVLGLSPSRELTFRILQEEQREWSERNFGIDRPSYQPLLGAVEELGELAHAHLKSEQGIRGTVEQHQANKRDAVGDVLIYLTDYCNREGFDLQELMEETWGEVKKRDWRANPTTGGVS